MYGLATVLIVIAVLASPVIGAHSLRPAAGPGTPSSRTSDYNALMELLGVSKKTAPKKRAATAHSGTIPAQARTRPAIVLPPALAAALPNVACGPASVLNIVAHEDDDLLFMNPDTLKSMRNGDCVRTIYLTAGDDGRGEAYWLGRQQGAQAAYGAMLGQPVTWEQRPVELGPAQHIVVSTPAENPKISLVFMDLPDGNLDGNGYVMWDRESLAKLESNTIAAIYSVDASSHYTPDELTQALTLLIQAYHPTEVRTQADEAAPHVGEHSDHIATSFFATRAVDRFNSSIAPDAPRLPVSYYVGYPTRVYPANLTSEQMTDKASVFFDYAQFDPNACASSEQCEGTSYGEYLQREYRR